MIPPRFRPLTTGQSSRAATEAAVRFLSDLWGYIPNAYTFMATRRGDKWQEHAITGDRLPKIAAILEAHPPERYDIYFCPNAFGEPHRRTSLAVPSRFAWCDIDDADPDAYDPQPNILWETSPSRFQAIWIWQDELPANVAQQMSRNIWAKDGGDKGGWSITKMLRLPGTINHKPEYQSPIVTLQVYDQRPQRLPRSILSGTPESISGSFSKIDIENRNPVKVMRRFRRAMGLKAGTLMTAKRVTRGDRSGAVYLIVLGMIKAGAEDSDIAAVLLVNPYFTSKWGNDLEAAQNQILRIRARWERDQ